ncbi:hypothetical protein NFB56_16065 [Yersinia ruckeri]|uniref:hypothetical protein n=1 Tax=Yersinia ruckeri TaxID=29486 RepID=UPI002238AEE0|nr:hypothetical protein [Yersinia ruckeri]MCW6550354.1 hypothetical protein [Yersinia ruckeri]
MLLIELLVQELPKRGGWPAGATRCVQDGDGMIKFDRTVSGISRIEHEWILNGQLPNCGFKHNICDDWHFCRVYHKQYEAALKPVWDGKGVPPVGTECELSGDKQRWHRVTIVAITKEHVITSNGNRESSFMLRDYTFRPIRTDRDEFVDSVSEILKPSPVGVDVKLAAVKLWNAGYRKV